MDFLELSLEDVRNKNKELFDKVKEYDYDAVVFVARGAYIIGKELAEFKNVPLLEVKAQRKGGKFKKLVRPLLQIIPEGLKKKLREKEMNKVTKAPNPERTVIFNRELWEKAGNLKRILLCDDSIDTGYSIKASKEKLEEFFKDAEVKIAVFNTFEGADGVIKADYSIYRNTCIKGPWSNDSLENDFYIKEYEKWHENTK